MGIIPVAPGAIFPSLVCSDVHCILSILIPVSFVPSNRFPLIKIFQSAILLSTFVYTSDS